MQTITAREARRTLSTLLNEAEHGSVISITRRGQEVARLVPPDFGGVTEFPDMTDFRNSIKVNGKSSSEVVVEMRDEERF